MKQPVLTLSLPQLDGPTAFQLIGILDAIVAELWIQYGDVIMQPPELASPDDEDPEDYSDLPF